MTGTSAATTGLIKDQPSEAHADWLAAYVSSVELISRVQTHWD